MDRGHAVETGRHGSPRMTARRLRTAIAAGTPCSRCAVRAATRIVSGLLTCATCAPAAALDRRIAQQRQDADRLWGRR